MAAVVFLAVLGMGRAVRLRLLMGVMGMGMGMMMIAVDVVVAVLAVGRRRRRGWQRLPQSLDDSGSFVLLLAAALPLAGSWRMLLLRCGCCCGR